MSEVCAPRYLAGLGLTLRRRHLCQKPLKGGDAYPMRIWLSAGIAL